MRKLVKMKDSSGPGGEEDSRLGMVNEGQCRGRQGWRHCPATPNREPLTGRSVVRLGFSLLMFPF